VATTRSANCCLGCSASKANSVGLLTP